MMHRIPFRAEILSILLAGGRDQRYLHARWVPWLLTAIPGRYRRGAALYLLSFSRHYFDWSFLYAPGRSKLRSLEAEYTRLQLQRESIWHRILHPWLRSTMTVLDFGCGPGFLALPVSRDVKEVIAVDVSRGALACARVLHNAPNLRYVLVPPGDLTVIPNNSVDLVYSFAVFYHLTEHQIVRTLHEFKRILRPGGKGVVHFAIPKEGPRDDGTAPGYRRGPFAKFRPLYRPYTAATVADEVSRAGLVMEEVASIANNWRIEDTQIGSGHLAIFIKPATAGDSSADS